MSGLTVDPSKIPIWLWIISRVEFYIFCVLGVHGLSFHACLWCSRGKHPSITKQQDKMDNQDFDIDVFLTNVESKLRGPFSSLDLAKSVTTTALRGSLTPPQYLQNLNKVLLRTDKVSQLRILIGLLGLEPEPLLDAEIYKILQTAQQESDEEWVRIIAGFIQGILFKDNDNNRESCRGEAAQELLKKTCQDIRKRVQDKITEQNDSCPPDLNAYFVPFRYSLIGKEVQKQIQNLKNGDSAVINPHFQAYTDAEILKIDEKLEAQRAKEARELAPIHLKTKTKGPTATASSSLTTKSNLPPGFKPTKLVQKAKAKPSSSMFVTRPNPAAQKAQLANRNKLLMRRKGGAQSLVNSSSAKSLQAKAMAARSASDRAMGATSKGRFSGGKSKVKMMNVEDVSSLQAKMKRDKEAAAANGKLSKKRSAIIGQEGASKKAKLDVEQQPSPKEGPSKKAKSKQESSSKPRVGSTPAQQQQQQQESLNQEEHEWKILLRERSNKLSDQDRMRVSQFFENNYHNPTPDQPVYKMKIHEQRVIDPQTGKNIKETFYLELDYQSKEYKQSKKVKRY